MDGEESPTASEQEDEIRFKDLPASMKAKRVAINVVLFAVFVSLLYLFICSLSLMGSGFQLVGGREVGETLTRSSLFTNPVAGLVLGILATVLLQSSSTTTSIIISMTASEILKVDDAIYIIMGANIGTSVTNTIVAMGQIARREEFERAFAGATVHDMFNFLTVLFLLPVEAITGYLLRLSTAIVDSLHLDTADKTQKKEFLKALTTPFTNRIIQLDKKQVQLIAEGKLNSSDAILLKGTCSTVTVLIDNCALSANESTNTTAPIGLNASLALNSSSLNVSTASTNCTQSISAPCNYLFHGTALSDSAVGAILLVWSIVMLLITLLLMVKCLSYLLSGHLSASAKKLVNADFPGRAAFLTGYVAILIGAGMTILVQSSSVFTSSLTPLVGLGIIDLERMYPLTLGANIGTTITGILAALASSDTKLALKVAFAHLFFNISGIILFYPVPSMRKFPLGGARFLGSKTAKYRWFAIVYVALVFFLLPALIFGLSIAGWWVLLAVGLPIVIMIALIATLNLLQKKKPDVLPEALQSWAFLPLWMRSLRPYDAVFTKLTKFAFCKRCRPYNEECCEDVSSTESAAQAQQPLTKRVHSQLTFTEACV